ncbi:hypothetical protein B0H17DRAFT_1197469 [Mycena rosella]|uniref:Uncharacterized protein n=1 Tax=Mycena rosella TaxID=1033263 RepID=A0AAD7DT13_MYCRO|nr:hypothetical protein B0H17DRAFT_1197469 [Mycena rosella]
MHATNNKPLETDETAPPVMPHTIRPYLLKAFRNFIHKNPRSLCHGLTYSWRPVAEGLQARAQHTNRAATYCVFGVVTNNTQPGLTLGRPELDNDGSAGRDICVAYEKQLDNLAQTLESQHMDSHLPNNELAFNTAINIPIAVGCALFATVSLVILDGSDTNVENF